ncbi:MAG: preprotein translocase subunit SecG [Verrucomicrobiota bacterium]|jgi:protein translocase SecG subunit
MSYLAGLLTCILLVNALLLILLVLVQLPKKDAGAGLAFGGGAADALFGAGSGNALTKITKWGIVVFVVLTLGLGYMQDHLHASDQGTVDFLKKVGQKQLAPAPMASSPVTPSPAPVVPSSPNALSSIQLTGTNSPVISDTNTTK